MDRRKPIATDKMAGTLRQRILRLDSCEILVSRLTGSAQEADITKPPNCAGLGRIRHFRRETVEGWPPNSLPIDPACKALGLPRTDVLEAEVFQNAACAWRCWYCYVPFDLLAGNSSRGEWVTADRLVELYGAEPKRPLVIDLSGGSPDLTPEWVVWMMESLKRAGLSDTTYLWSDDNLSTDYVFTKLSTDDRRKMSAFRNYGRVCCFKGFDSESFAFNTGAEGSGYSQQFEMFKRYTDLEIDLYAYATFTGPNPTAVRQGIPDFVDRLQAVAENLPLRLVPLRVEPFGPMLRRTTDADRASAAHVQDEAIVIWNQELERRFPSNLRESFIADVKLRA